MDINKPASAQKTEAEKAGSEVCRRRHSGQKKTECDKAGNEYPERGGLKKDRTVRVLRFRCAGGGFRTDSPQVDPVGHK